MFDSKFLIFITGILILCLVLCFAFSNSVFEGDSDSNATSSDVEYIWMMDDDGQLESVPTTETYSEGSASAPG